MINSKLHPALNSPIDDDVDGIQVNHNKLLADLVESGLPLIAIARDHKLTLAQLIAWAAQPAIRALLDAADELANRIAAHKAAQGRTAAVQTLIGHASGLCESPRDRDLASRAARTIVRATNPPKPTRARRTAAKAGATPDAPRIVRHTTHEPIDSDDALPPEQLHANGSATNHEPIAIGTAQHRFPANGRASSNPEPSGGRVSNPPAPP